jgi:hypothetical protein
MEFLEVPIFDDDVFKLLVRFAIDITFLSLIVIFAIYPMQRQREFAFTAVMMNITVFFICFALKKLDLGLGMALGLFAIFGVLRYRTDAIGIQEMTYLFIVIGIAVINSLSNRSTSYTEIALVNLLILGSAMLKQYIMGKRIASNEQLAKDAKVKPEKDRQPKYTIEYDRLDLLGTSERDALISDIRSRTGLDIEKIQIQQIDLLSNKATLMVWCEASNIEVAAAS